MSLVDQGGSASGQPLVSDKTLYLCTCRQCASELAELKPSTDGQQQQQGLYLNGVMYQRHQKEEKIVRELENEGLDKFGQEVWNRVLRLPFTPIRRVDRFLPRMLRNVALLRNILSRRKPISPVQPPHPLNYL